MNYRDKLDDPRWAKKRLKIFRRDNFKCTVCGSVENIQVHHTYYVERADPWMYPDESLLTLCEKCHHEYHEYHELTILPAFLRSNNKKSDFRRNKNKKARAKKMREKYKPQIRSCKNSSKYQRCINGVWVTYKLGY